MVLCPNKLPFLFFLKSKKKWRKITFSKEDCKSSKAISVNLLNIIFSLQDISEFFLACFLYQQRSEKQRLLLKDVYLLSSRMQVNTKKNGSDRITKWVSGIPSVARIKCIHMLQWNSFTARGRIRSEGRAIKWSIIVFQVAGCVHTGVFSVYGILMPIPTHPTP